MAMQFISRRRDNIDTNYVSWHTDYSKQGFGVGAGVFANFLPPNSTNLIQK